MSPRLVVDAGNSRIKWGVHADGAWLAQGALAHHELDQLQIKLQQYPAVTHAVVSNVAGPAVAAALQALLDAAGIDMQVVRAGDQACGVSNHYADPAALGPDRWAAAVAAWQRKQAACIVACAGTALTVDALAVDTQSGRGMFLGGLILPGLALMQSSLATAAAGLADGSGGQFAAFPATTRDAVHSGALQAMAGAIERMAYELGAREGAPPAILLSGGDAAVLAARLPAGSEIVDNLVLEGLVLLAREIAS